MKSLVRLDAEKTASLAKSALAGVRADRKRNAAALHSEFHQRLLDYRVLPWWRRLFVSRPVHPRDEVETFAKSSAWGEQVDRLGLFAERLALSLIRAAKRGADSSLTVADYEVLESWAAAAPDVESGVPW